jgi:hypothetical protein
MIALPAAVAYGTVVGNINGLAHLIGRDDLLQTWSVVL